MIGVDIGTTSTKAVLFNTDGVVQHKAQIEYALHTPRVDVSEQDPQIIVHAVTETISEVVREGHVQPDALQFISFSAQMHSLLLIDEQQRPLTKSITWADNRARFAAEDLLNHHDGHTIYQRTGTPIHAMSPLSKLWWLKQDETALFETAARYVDIKSYVLYQLTGEWVMDASIASATGLYNLKEQSWDEEVLSLLEIPDSKLPKLVSTTHVLEFKDDNMAEKLGLRRDLPIVVGASDGVLSNLGVNSFEPGEVAITIGTSGAIRTVVDHPVIDEKGRIFCYVLDDEHYVIGGPVNNGGVVLRWLRDELLASEIETAKRLGIETYDVMSRIAQNVQPGAQGLLFHPYLTGERAPLWTSDARGSFIGLTLSHQKEHMIRAVMEGVLFNLYTVFLALIEVIGTTPQSIKATGGFSKSHLWRQMMADIFNTYVEIPKSYESSCLGACVLGLKALEQIDNYDIVKAWVGATHQHQPEPSHVDVYQKLASIFIQISRDLSPSYQTLAQFQRDLEMNKE
ncbi:gluconate kinase [Staphylococcus intermedius NCTC 11048]|uniref:Gluconate kinase n=2 Tax=Staphylococcus intermedius TaxID=1285 RepID=A0A380G6Z4_STAIN|nr:gluconate kinase [Staphylococcus intermedius NCTC 11048]